MRPGAVAALHFSDARHLRSTSVPNLFKPYLRTAFFVGALLNETQSGVLDSGCSGVTFGHTTMFLEIDWTSRGKTSKEWCNAGA
jgi:hypothetical protein